MQSFDVRICAKSWQTVNIISVCFMLGEIAVFISVKMAMIY